MSLAAELPKHCAQLSGIDSPWEVKPVELKGGERRGEIQLGWPWGRAAKELLSKFWAQEEAGWARRFFKDWLGGMSRSPYEGCQVRERRPADFLCEVFRR